MHTYGAWLLTGNAVYVETIGGHYGRWEWDMSEEGKYRSQLEERHGSVILVHK